MTSQKHPLYGAISWPKICPDGYLYRQIQNNQLLWSNQVRRTYGGFMKYLKKPSGSGGKGDLKATDKVFAANYPALFEFLTIDEWSKGEARKTMTLRLFVEGGKWKACMVDREGGRVAFTTGDSVEGLFLLCDEQLREDTADWRPDKYASRR